MKCPWCKKGKNNYSIHSHGWNKIGSTSSYIFSCKHCKKSFELMYQYYKEKKNNKIWKELIDYKEKTGKINMEICKKLNVDKFLLYGDKKIKLNEGTK